MKKITKAIALLLICIMLAGCASKEKESIIVGAKDFTEQEILGHMLLYLIETNTNLEITYRSNMASHIIFAAITTGAIDLYIDYTGTVYGSYLNHSEAKSAEEVHEISVRELKEQHDLRMLAPLGFNNTFCLAVRPDTAAAYNLKTFSDLAQVSSNYVFGGSAEILSRNDGIPNLKRVYDMSFKDEVVLADASRYVAIINDEIQITEAFSTDALLMEHDLVVLEDDKNFFPPYHGVVIMREEIAEKHPQLLEIFGRLEGILTDEVMRNLNHRVDVRGESPKDVAESFLMENNF